MRALTMDELGFVSGGSVTGTWGGSRTAPYQVLSGTQTEEGKPVDIIYVFGAEFIDDYGDELLNTVCGGGIELAAVAAGAALGHRAGVQTGMIGGAILGTAVGAVAGPAGMYVGGVGGAVVGTAAGAYAGTATGIAIGTLLGKVGGVLICGGRA
jgi:hypothetical protein